MSHSTAAEARPDRAVDSRPHPAAATLLLLGGLAGIAQLLVPWVSNTKEPVTGWGQYFGVAHHGAAAMIAAYAIIVVALAGLVMTIAAIRMFGFRPSYRNTTTAGAIGAAVALVCALYYLAAGQLPEPYLFTFGFYLFMTAGLFGLLGLGLAAGRLTAPATLLILGGAGGALQIVLPWFTSSTRAVSGWQQYYATEHPTTAELIGAYAIPIAAIAGVVILVCGLVSMRGANGFMTRLATVAALVLVACAALQLALSDTRGIPSFGYYLFLISGLVALAGVLIGRATTPALLLVLAGLAGVAQVALPWFDKETGFGFYYRTSHGKATDIIAAYGVLISLIAGIVLLVAGLVIQLRPAAAKPAARAARIAAIAMLVVLAWWLLLGPHPLAAALAGGGFGWYLFIAAALTGLAGAGIVLAKAQLSFDKASFMVVFLGVPLAIFLLFVVSPFIQAIYYSMTDWKGFSADMNFTGLDNYIKLFHDDTFRKAVFNNIKLGIVVPLVTIILALAIASMVTVGGPSRGPVRGLKASSFYRVVSFFPYTVPAIVIGIIWSQVYDPARGILNKVLTSIGLDGFTNFAWLGEKSTAMGASMFVIIWSFVGFYAVLFIASIKGISAEVYEAAKLDGAGRFRTAVSVTIPLIRDTIQTAYIYIGIAALDGFVYMMALNPFGGPDNSTLVMSQDLYNTAFRKGQFGYATSMGVILAVVTLLFATLVFVVNRVTSSGPPIPKRQSKRRASRAAASITAPAGQGAI